jgi:long-chain acyl-CoA synthetase
VREFSEPATVDVADEDNLSDMVFATAERFGGSVLYRRKARDTWVDVTAREFAAQVLAVAKGLVAAGIEPGDRVGLLSRTRYEWTLLDFAILTTGGVTVPIYETSSAEQIQWILSDSGARALLIETREHRDRLNCVQGELPGLDHIWQLDEAADELPALGASAGVADEDMHDRRRRVRAGDTASLVYTSGTTGRPRGCRLTHRNLLAEVRTAIGAAPELLNSGASVLLFLPLAHVFARLIQFGALHARVTLGHTADARNLLDDLAEFRPTLVLSVPRVLEKIYTRARQQALATGRGRIFELGEATAVAWSQAHRHGRPGLRLRLAHAVFDRLMFQRLRATLGGRCGAAISGGAPLGERLGHFFAGVGMPVYEGYGLTETSAALTLNTPARHKIGTVGRPLPGVAVRIGDDREIQVAGTMVFGGYWNNEQANAAAFTEDGWLRTGDLGELDGEGYLRITGRRKELIVTGGLRS